MNWYYELNFYLKSFDYEFMVVIFSVTIQFTSGINICQKHGSHRPWGILEYLFDIHFTDLKGAYCQPDSNSETKRTLSQNRLRQKETQDFSSEE